MVENSMSYDAKNIIMYMHKTHQNNSGRYTNTIYFKNIILPIIVNPKRHSRALQSYDN